MENTQGNLKATGEKKMRKCGIFSFILMALVTLNFWMVPVSAKNVGKARSFVSTEEPLNFDQEDYDYESESEKEEPVENFDPIPQFQPSLKNVFTLLKNVQVELVALSNKTTQENQELKNEMVDVYNKLLDQENEIRELNQTASRILKGQGQLKQKIRANHDEVKKEFTNLSQELKNPPTSLFNQHPKQEKDEPKPQPTPKPTTTKPKETTVKVHADAPKPKPNPTSSPRTAPQFYSFEQFGGPSFTPSTSEWKTKCVDLPLIFSGFVSSLKTGGYCLFVCPEKNCQPETFGYSSTQCQTINPKSREMGKLIEIKMDNKIKSFRQC